MVSPVIVKKPTGLKVFWTVDADVGLSSPNRPEDVQLVQLGYAAMLANPRAAKTPEERSVYAKVVPGSACSGRADDPLVQAIVLHQKLRGGTQDGHVSKFTASTVGYVDATGSHSHMLLALVNNLSDMIPNDYPRLDKHPSCPGLLKTAVVKACSA